MADQPYHMWGFWSDKYGPVTALKDYYPETLAASENLKLAVAQYENSKCIMHGVMENLRDDEEEENADGLD